MKNFNRLLTPVVCLTALLCVLVAGISVSSHRQLSELKADLEAVNSELILEKNQREAAEKLDTSYIENWCGDYANGRVKIIGGWAIGETHDKKQIIEDEKGQIWIVEFPSIGSEEYLLLWIADNNTPDNMSDDIVLHVWEQLHG